MNCSLEHDFTGDNCHFNSNVADRGGIDAERVVGEYGKIGQLAGADRALLIFHEFRKGTAHRKALQSLPR